MKWDNFVNYVWSNRTEGTEIILCMDKSKIILIRTTTSFISLLQKYAIDSNFRFVDNGDSYWAIFGK